MGRFPAREELEKAQTWLRGRLEGRRAQRPLMRVLMHPVAGQVPERVVMRDLIERLGGRVTMLPELDPARLPLLALRHDVLHLHDLTETVKGASWLGELAGAPARLAQVEAARALGLKIVWSLSEQEARMVAEDRLPDLARRWLITHADRLLCDSRRVERLIGEARPDIPDGRLAYAPPFSLSLYYPCQVSRRAARAHLGLVPQGRVFLVAGDVHPYKGLSELVELFDKHPLNEHTLLIAGAPVNGAYAATLEGLCKRRPNVFAFLRRAEREDMQFDMQAADYLVMPPQDPEPWRALMLALTFAKPLVAPNVGALGEWLGAAHAVLYDDSRPGAQRAALAQALELDLDRAQRELRQLNEENHAEKAAKRLFNVYLSLFPTRHAPLDESDEV